MNYKYLGENIQTVRKLKKMKQQETYGRCGNQYAEPFQD